MSKSPTLITILSLVWGATVALIVLNFGRNVAPDLAASLAARGEVQAQTLTAPLVPNQVVVESMRAGLSLFVNESYEGNPCVQVLRACPYGGCPRGVDGAASLYALCRGQPIYREWWDREGGRGTIYM